MRRALALVLVALVLPWGVASANGPDPAARCATTLESRVHGARLSAYTEDVTARAWPTWHVRVGDVPVPPPPSPFSAAHAAERAELHALQASRTDEEVARARAFDGPAGAAWSTLALDLLREWTPKDATLDPPRISRHLAILETAMFDALVLAYEAKYCHGRAPPSWSDPTLAPAFEVPPAPSYPSEHAVAAGAASVVLASMFPQVSFEPLAREAADARVLGGASYRSDVEAGLALGQEVARRVLAARSDDGHDAVWDGVRPTGVCLWDPAADHPVPTPLEPAWGRVRPWLMPSSSHVRPPPPPACDTPEYVAEARDLWEASKALTDAQRSMADRWAGGPGTETPPGMAVRVAVDESVSRELTTMQHARAMAVTAVAVADAGVAAWDAKFTYWSDRPVKSVARLFEPGWVPYLKTPPFPGYVSGHSTFSGAGFGALALLFPEDAARFDALAREASDSRFYGGIHVDADSRVGLDMGRAIAELAGARAASMR